MPGSKPNLGSFLVYILDYFSVVFLFFSPVLPCPFGGFLLFLLLSLDSCSFAF